MDPDSIKFAKRKLRVQRCKTVTGQHIEDAKTKISRTTEISSLNKTSSNYPNDKQRTSTTFDPSMRTKIPEIPKGNPYLGQKLIGLSKEMRKQVKATDHDRLARRLAKKKARAALARANVGAKGSGFSARNGNDKKERARQRKSVRGKETGNLKKKSKGRVRSDKALAKMNVKKS